MRRRSAIQEARTAKDDTGIVLTDIHNLEQARALLEKEVYLVHGEQATPATLVTVIMQAAAGMAKMPRSAINIMRAVAFILNSITNDSIIASITSVVASRLDDHFAQLKVIETNLLEQEDQLRAAATSATNTIEEFRADMDGITEQLEDASKAVNTVAETVQAGQSVMRASPPASYAAAVRAIVPIPLEHAASIIKGDIFDRQIIVAQDPSAQGDVLAMLTEKELVEKAKITLDLMGMAAADRPDDLAFVGARRTQAGSILYQLNSAEAAKYMRNADVMREFLNHFGVMSVMRARTFQVIVEYVLVTFAPTELFALGNVEEASSLPAGSILEARWLKPAHLRSEAQRYAFLIVGFGSREAANHAIEYGVFVEGKKCKTWKMLPEPQQCMKCQRFGHRAIDCKAIHDMCVRCGDMHRMADPQCKIDDRDNFKCSNCLESGHGAVDRRCKIFVEKLRQMKERVPETKYKLFPTNEPPMWMRADEENMGVGSFDNTWRSSGPLQQQQRGGGWQSQGRLAGGQRSGGTSRDGDVGRRMGGGQASRRENSGRGASCTGGGFGADSRQVTLEGMWGSQRSTSQNA
jgi:hypothetical protein